MRVENCLPVLGVDADDGAAAAIDITKEIALILVGRRHFNLHDRLENDRTSFLDRFFEGKDASHLESELVGIDFVERAVNDLRLDVDHLVTCIHAAANGFFDAIDDRRHIFLRDRTANNLVDNLDTFALFIGLNRDARVTVLTTTTRLANELALAVSILRDRFPIRDLRSTNVRFDFELALEPVDDDFKVKLTHSSDDQLPRFLVGEAAKRRIFFREALQAFGHLVAILLGLRLDGHADDRLRERRRFERHVEIFVAQSVASSDVAQTDERGDIAGVHLVDVLAFAALNDHQAADAFALACARVVNIVTLFELAGVNAEEH